MNKKNIIVVVASKSEDKINGIKEAFSQYYPSDKYDVKIYSSYAESNVDSQPFGNETYQGAINRINNVKNKYEKIFEEKDIKVDYYVSCEAGIDNTNIVEINNQQSTIFNSEQVVCIYDTKTDNYFFGKSSTWMIPTDDIKEIQEINLDSYLRKRGCTGLHDIGNGMYISRKEAVKEGTQSAISSLLFFERNKKINKEREL